MLIKLMKWQDRVIDPATDTNLPNYRPVEDVEQADATPSNGQRL
jgi:hypothetical protein